MFVSETLPMVLTNSQEFLTNVLVVPTNGFEQNVANNNNNIYKQGLSIVLTIHLKGHFPYNKNKVAWTYVELGYRNNIF